MPELPEVETLKSLLEPDLIGTTFVNISSVNDKVIAHPDCQQFIDQLSGSSVIKLTRRGKFINIYLDTGKILTAHMRMTGRLFTVPKDTEIHKHTHLNIELSNGKALRFVDPRRFGRLWLCDANECEEITGIKKLGLDPFDKDLTLDYLKEKLKKRKCAVKTALLNQEIVSGIGNIYADEILFFAKISPEVKVTALKDEDLERIVLGIKEVISKNVKSCKVTAEDFLEDNLTYRNSELLQVYGHEGEPCPRCGIPIKMKRIGGRSSFYCPNCQK